MKNEPQRTRSFPLCARNEYPLNDVTERIIACAMEVHSTLGPGLLESVYEEALAHEFTLRNVSYEKQKEIYLKFKGKEVGKHKIDFLVENIHSAGIESCRIYAQNI